MLDEVVDVVLRHEMRDVVFAVGYLRTIRQSAPDVVLQSRGFGCRSGEVEALGSFDLDCFLGASCREGLEEVCHCVNVG